MNREGWVCLAELGEEVEKKPKRKTPNHVVILRGCEKKNRDAPKKFSEPIILGRFLTFYGLVAIHRGCT